VDVNVFKTANAGFAQALYEDFLRDPASVPAEWRRLFESGVVGEAPPPSGNGSGPTADAGTSARTATAAVPADAAVPLKGAALRLAANMEESLAVPTATTFRQLPVATLERRRAELNAALAAAGRDVKISFTHLIGWALVRAATAHPVMSHSFRRADGTAHRVTPEHVNLGLAVDVVRKDGSRGLVVPVIKAAETMDFARFHAAYEEMVEKARTHRLLPDDFAGASITLTNPGGLGTSASVPRLMAGQGTIVAVGSIGYPAEFAGLASERLTALGLAKVMTLTSTYDHRVIQGAESGEFLRTMDRLLQGESDFYEGLFAALGVPTAGRQAGPKAGPGSPVLSDTQADPGLVAAAMGLVDHYRTHGHLAARLDPLGGAPAGDPGLDPVHHGLTPEVLARIPASVLRVWVPGATLAEVLPNLQATYCGTLAYEFEHVSNHEERAWLREVIESGAHRRTLNPDAQRRLLARLTQVEALERFLHKTYLGQKRFSIEGLDTLIPMLDLAIETAADAGAREVVLGMAHRGRLNVLAHTVGRPYVTIFAEFEGTPKADPGGLGTEEPGTGDVKYHLGAEGAYVTSTGKAITVTLAHNPSHLEFVCPVVNGRARAEQTQRRGREAHLDAMAALPILIHGDAAFAAQGVVAETLNLGNLPGYATGGTIHLIANNQIGFTTDIRDARSTMYSSDLAKGFDIPIVHVNADDPEACLDAIRLAMMYRNRFHQDMVIDLVGYRRHGHNEGDEPTYTQPLMYGVIKDHPTVRAAYAQRLVRSGVVPEGDGEARFEAAYEHLVQEHHALRASLTAPPPAEPTPRRVVAPEEPTTAVSADVLEALNEYLLHWPEGFAVHPKLARQLERRRPALRERGGIEWAHAEALAFASLLTEGIPIRLTGQDTERGTFSQRHLVLHDVAAGTRYAPIQHLPGALAPFELHNSPLSELAALGFEYGYSAAAPEVLVLWEAQFGDFVNSAQVVVDQFIAGGITKWGVTARLTLLLPHAYEGQGPEHSSARPERFLQLAAEGNLRIANCTTPAQYFHLIRRQALRPRIRPLVVLTPKSLLRHPRAGSSLSDLSQDRFHRVLDDAWARERPREVASLILCSGKVYYDLLVEAERMASGRPAIARVEQLYSFPDSDLRELCGGYPDLEEVVWAQEEPRNMGAWDYIAPRLEALLPAGVTLRYAGRPERASPAEGYPAAHADEQAKLVAEALRLS
jgi:2-oxoglutarate dehydrogenase E1 component